MSTLDKLIAAEDIVVAPGVYDALSALMAADSGFKALYLSGAAIAYTRLARPDIGLVGPDEVASVIGAVCERVETPLIVDADTGFGNALNVARTVKRFERLGAAAIQIEDQSTPKRCGHLADKSLVSKTEMVGKIKAALDARAREDFLVIARTDAIAVEGLDAALDRAAAYAEAGADMLFVEAPPTREDMATMIARLGKRAPLMANMVEGGKTPAMSAAELQEIGFALVIFPAGLVRALTHMAREYFESLQANGTTAPYRDRMLDFAALQELVGTEEMLAAGKRYDEGGEE